MSRSKRRLEQIKQNVEITQVLSDYGYKIHLGGSSQEQQFPCDLHGDGSDGKPSARVYPATGQWYCVSMQDRVLTNQGWKTLGEVSDCPILLDGDGLFQQPLAYLDRGVRSCITLRTGAGYEVTLTPDHEVAIVGKGWVRAGDVCIGDAVVIPRPKHPAFNSDRRIPVEVFDLNSRVYKGHPNLALPDTWDSSLGEFLGYLFGDGWVTFRPGGGSVGITSSAIDAADARRVFGNLQRWSGGRGSEKHRTDQTHTPNGKSYTQDQYTFNVGNDGVCEWLRRLGFGKESAPQDRRLPFSIWLAPEDAIRGFLRGIYATDGSVFRPKDRKGVKVHLYSVSQGFLKDIQLLLLQFGIASSLAPPAKTRPDGVWDLRLPTGKDIVRFRDQIGFANERKAKVLESFEYCHMGTKPFVPKIKEILVRGDLPVADVTMPEDPSFVAGGIKVHNCFACSKSRDVVETVRAKEGLEFMPALAFIEAKYNLPQVPWEDDDRQDDTPVQKANSVKAILDTTKTFADDRVQYEAVLRALTEDRLLEMDTLLAHWEALDKVAFNLEQKTANQANARLVLAKLHERLSASMNQRYRPKESA